MNLQRNFLLSLGAVALMACLGNLASAAILSQVLADGASATFSVDTAWLQDAVNNIPAGTDGEADAFETMRLTGFTVEGNAVPEPSTSLLLAGAAVLAGRRRS